MSDFDDEFAHRAQLLRVLQEDDDEVVGDVGEDDVPHLSVVAAEEMAGAYNDEIEQADTIARTVVQADALDLKAQIREQKFQKQAERAPWARINPQSANRGTLGGQQQVFSGGSALQVAMWGADDDVEALPVTVTFAPVQQSTVIVNTGSLVAPQLARPFGIVQFGTRGFLVKAFIDIGKGCEFTVGASFVSLQVGMDLASTLNPPAFMRLAGMLSFYPIERETPITRTLYFDGISAASTPTEIPPFAKTLYISRSGAAGVGVVVDFLASDAFTPVGTVSVPGGVWPTEQEFLVPPDAFFVVVTPAAGPVDVRLIFGLSF